MKKRGKKAKSHEIAEGEKVPPFYRSQRQRSLNMFSPFQKLFFRGNGQRGR
jgi:hypothetical protein